MATRRILAIIIALLMMTAIFSGCGANAKNEDKILVESTTFNLINEEGVGSYVQTHFYDIDTNVEYVYLWHKRNGTTASTKLYMPDGTLKLYSGEESKLVLASAETIGFYTQTLMYDSETLVMYCISWHRGSGYVTLDPLYNADGTLKTY